MFTCAGGWDGNLFSTKGSSTVEEADDDDDDDEDDHDCVRYSSILAKI